MALKLCACQSNYVNFHVNILRKQDELASGQNSAKSSYTRKNKAFIPLETLILPFILFFTKDLFIKFRMMFMEITKAQAQVLVKL